MSVLNRGFPVGSVIQEVLVKHQLRLSLTVILPTDQAGFTAEVATVTELELSRTCFMEPNQLEMRLT